MKVHNFTTHKLHIDKLTIKVVKMVVVLGTRLIDQLPILDNWNEMHYCFHHTAPTIFKHCLLAVT